MALVLTQVAGGVATVTLNRPEARNALSGGLVEALSDALGAVAGEVEAGRARVVVLAGAGKAFSAGMDLKAVMSDPPAMRTVLEGLAAVLVRIRALPAPVIASVRGAAIGGGCGLMVAADLAVTHAEARIGYPEVSLGLCPAVVAPWLIGRIGAGRARAMLLEGRLVSGREAVELGLATHLAPLADLDAQTTGLAGRLAEGSPEALATTKRWLNELEGGPREEIGRRGAELSAEVLARPEAQRRLRARFSED